MREFAKHSSADNAKYLKQNDRELYDCLVDITKSLFVRYDALKEHVDEKDEFFVMLNTLKRYVPAAIVEKYNKEPARSPTLRAIGRIEPIVDVFEWMFLNAVERSVFDNMDSDVQQLYLKAQQRIDIEEQIMTLVNESVKNQLGKIKGVVMDKVKRDQLNSFIAVEIAQAVSRILRKYDEVTEDNVEKKEEASTHPLQTVYNAKGAVLDLYWGGMNSKEIAEQLDLNWSCVNEVLNKEIPVEKIYMKYERDKTRPSLIARDAEIKKYFKEELGLKVTTNHIRRVLNMPLV